MMGILNVTPDSFFDGGSYFDPEMACDRVAELIDAGADLIDIGGESTRPGALLVDDEEEMRRLKPVLKAVGHRSAVPISIDTRKSLVAKMALDFGAVIVNDVSALRHDSNMVKIVADSGAGVVLMHMQGTPESMQDSPEYVDVVRDVKEFFINRLAFADKYNISSDRIVLDPGIGFGKNITDNLSLISQCDQFLDLDLPIMVGVSNKTFIGKILDKSIGERAMGTAAALAIAIFQGSQIIRIHDIDLMRDVTKMASHLRDSGALFQRN